MPLETVQQHGRTVVRLHGSSQRPAELAADDVTTILAAMAEGSDVDLDYVIIPGSFALADVWSRFEHTEDGRQRVAGNVLVCHCVFRELASFDGASFGGRVDFSATRFMRNASFSGAAFCGDADFCAVVFDGDAAFSEVLFRGDARFEEAEFHSEAQFSGAFAVRPATFFDVKFRENSVPAGLWNHIVRPALNRLARPFRRELPERRVTTFLGLNPTIMDGASNPYLKRYVGDEQWIRSWRRRGRFRHVMFLIWELSSHCGRSFGLWIFWVLVVAVAFGAVFADYSAPAWLPEPVTALLIRMDPEFAVSSTARIPTPFTPYYFSIVTFTTLGFGDIQPLDLAGEVWLAIEVLFGYIMLGGLIGIFANKFARRS